MRRMTSASSLSLHLTCLLSDMAKAAKLRSFSNVEELILRSFGLCQPQVGVWRQLMRKFTDRLG